MFTEDWKYRSVIGKLNFLTLYSTLALLLLFIIVLIEILIRERHTMRFLKTIGKYLKTALLRGLVYHLQGDQLLHTMCDAIFFWTWTDQTTQQQSFALSKTGSVILYSGRPVLWHSKQQTEIVLSTCKAEYIALS